MQGLKASLTRIQGKLNEKLPEGEDVFGFKGVNKKVLNDELERIKHFLSDVDRLVVSNFDVISLKRTAATLTSKLSTFIEKGLDNPTIFNDFLNTLSLLSEKTILVFCLTNKNGIHADEELSIIREAITQYNAELATLTTLNKTFSDLKTTIQQQKEELVANITAAVTLAQQTKEEQANLETRKLSIEKLYSASKKKSDSINTIHETLQPKQEQIENLHKTATENQIQTDKLLNQIKEAYVVLSKNGDRSNSLLKEINQMLAGATRIGLAKSFNDAKREITISQRWWCGGFIASIIALIGMVIYSTIHYPLDVMSWQSYLNLIPKLLFTAPIIWFAWFAGDRYGHLDLLKDDYSYKYALSMAYDGYKKSIAEISDKEVNKKMTNQLLEAVLGTVSSNPRLACRLEKVSATPLEKFLNGHSLGIKYNTTGISAHINETNSQEKDSAHA